ncbi:MAE_28990/MAE_18760 family HEPN-like nuclease [Ulvibacter litoralis]|uniref:RiboL-PSP-HEPN domain-containing protein n=1 Tax=Ulvibacter litoralis TaxID=227084 RepID=A0A1G7JT68_9FLAO|nr:MAE_28990/MAE_18760 family HEPN-like nuclease [Ulvibacter litoralis]GHC65963.1 hypothetical protein GCM10008083_33850 [Ulvibacter litoralis]SDF27984.1 hypothetical protein SAMN05421855_1281 [Ulvibacter litoralis]
MSFSNLRSQNSSRFNEVQVFLNYITSQEPSLPTDPTPAEVKIMRGLFYVHLYAALEKSMNEVVQKSLLLISAKGVKSNHYTLAFNTISVMDKIQALKDCGYKKVVNKSILLFEQIDSRTIRPLNETVFSKRLQNVWMETIEETIGAFGMAELNIQPRVRATIDEIVDKRNAVAHGGESASYIGERHRANILRNKFQIAQDFMILVIDSFEEYYDNKKYLKPVVKRHYA